MSFVHNIKKISFVHCKFVEMFILFYITPTTLSSSITYLRFSKRKISEKNSVTLGELLWGVLWKAVSVTELKNSDLRDTNTGLYFF